MGTRDQELVNVVNAGKGLTDLFRPQVTQTNVTGGTPHDNQQVDDLINMLMGKAGGDGSQFQPLIDNIMHRAALSFAPILGEQANSGGYNSTALRQLAGETQARATGESADAILRAQTEAAKTAATLTDAKIQTNKQATETKKPQLNVGDLLKTLGIGYAARKGLNAVEGIKISKYFNAKEAAEASDAGYLPETANSVLGDSGNASFTGMAGSDIAGGASGAGETGSIFADAGLSSSGVEAGLTADEVSFIMGTAGDAAAGNAAALASFTDASVPNSIAEVSPQAYGDFGTLTADAESGATVTGANTSDLGITGSPLVEGVDTTIGGASNASDVLSSVSSETALGGAGAATAGSDAAVAIDAGMEFGGAASTATDIGGGAGAALEGAGAAWAGPAVAIPIAVEIAKEVGGDFVTDVAGSGGAVEGIGQGLGGIADSAGSAISDAWHDTGNFLSDTFDTVICTELNRQGLMSDSMRRYNAIWANRNINSTALAGYRDGWGPVYVRWMRRSKIATALGLTVMSSWSSWIRGKRNATIIGAIFIPLVWIPSWLIGKWMQVKEVFAHA